MLHKLKRKIKSIFTPLPTAEALRHGMVPVGENISFKRYIIFGHQRCGSSVLTSGLKSHQNIKAFAELFTPSHITFNYPGYDNYSLPLLKLRNKQVERFLDEVIFCGQEEGIDAVGFKVFPDQINTPKFEPVWDYIDEHKDIALVMLNRENSLATLCSVVIAEKTGVWGIKDAAKRPTVTINLSAQQCEAFFLKREKYAQMVIDRFPDREIYQVSYETFQQDIPRYLETVQKHIGLNPSPLPVNDLKKEVRKLDQIIENYGELKAHFNGTKWQSYFTE